MITPVSCSSLGLAVNTGGASRCRSNNNGGGSGKSLSDEEKVRQLVYTLLYCEIIYKS